MKTRFEYIAKSKNKSLKFDKNSYILNLKDEGKLLKGDVLRYGYLTNIVNIGDKRGWFISYISMSKYEIEQRYEFNKGEIVVNI